MPPNILYLHSHDTGRYVQPYGHHRDAEHPAPRRPGAALPPGVLRGAECSGSRASLLTGQWAHVNGMTGLAHRGWTLHDYGRHMVPPLREAGYWSAHR